ncbi:MAG: hypothetical protein KatS3mg042_1777 [Rhodothermaceae bacterium]|nr:MAG: hypothetical protein KatS3mg042_0963 [Rhodothermaceae bacterium]GIV58864.1 MAG: hypothetical protein KatS3mg042_1777 [Rhodothermaceae bacterium]
MRVEYVGLVDTFRVQIVDTFPFRVVGKTQQAFVWTRGRGEMETKWLMQNREDGLHFVGGVNEQDTLLLSENTLRLRYPAEVGDRWTAYRLSYDWDEGSFSSMPLDYELLSTAAPYQTPAGEFICYQYHFRFRPAEDVFEEWDVYEYYAPGVGRVAEVIKGSFDGRVIQTTELLSYHVQAE